MTSHTTPNILFLHCDSMDGRVMGCADHPAAHTPNLDRLAAHGTRFHSAYCPFPVCVGSRVATWSGRHAHRSQTWGNACGQGDDAGTIVAALAEAGYDTVAIGRDDRYADGHGPASRLGQWTRSSGLALTRSNQTVLRPPSTEAGERVHAGDWQTTDRAVAWLEARSGKAKPFFCSVGFHAPHPPYHSDSYWLDRIDPAAITLPPAESVEHPAMRFMRITKGVPDNLDADTIREIRRTYCAMIAEVDAQVGRILDQLAASGLADRTLVVFFSDHGDMQMEHGQTRKCSLFESSVRVPLILAGPGITAGVTREEAVSLLDLSPTLRAIAGLPEDVESDGTNLLAAQPTERPIIAQYHDVLQPTGSFMLRVGPWKLIDYIGMEPQLFHLDEDPDEIDDRSTSDAAHCQALREQLRSLLPVDDIDRAAKDHDRRCFLTWRALTGRQGSRDILKRIYPTISDDDLDHLDHWCGADRASIAAIVKGISTDDRA